MSKIVVLLCALCGAALHGQQNTGALLGAVSDPRAAMIPGAPVEVIHVATNIGLSLVTPQFHIPNRVLGTSQFGSITNVVNTARQIQFALKFRW